MAKTTVTSDYQGYSLNTELKALRQVSDAKMTRSQGKRLREAAEIVAMKAREIASAFSTRIPLSVKITGGASRVYIRAGGPVAPNAYPFETGARHPLFGNRNWWYPQPVHEFMEDAYVMTQNDVADAFALVIDDWCKELNLM